MAEQKTCPKCGCPLDPDEKCVCETIIVPPLRLRLAASSESLCRDALEEIERLDAREARVRELADNYAGEELREGMYTGTTVAQDILEALEDKING